MGLFGNNNNDLFGGLFDFNGDGKTSWDEEYIAYRIFEECTKDDNSSGGSYGSYGSDYSGSYGNYNRYEWRESCEDGTEFGVDPEDYETEEEYNEALYKAKYGWRECCESFLDTGVDPEDYETEEEYDDALYEAKYGWREGCPSYYETGVLPEAYETEKEYWEALRDKRFSQWASDEPDSEDGFEVSDECPDYDELDKIKQEDYPNIRRYNAACTLADMYMCYGSEEFERYEKSRCKFILKNADRILAADYLSNDGGFLYAQAIKDNFKLPCSLPDEDEKSEMWLPQILCKIAKRDIPLSLEIWHWCLKQFLPYSQYDKSSARAMSTGVIDYLYKFPDEYMAKLVHYIDENHSFSKKLFKASEEPADSLPQLIAVAISENCLATAKYMFRSGLRLSDGQWKMINRLTEGVIQSCENYKELESIEYFRDNLFPFVKEIKDGMVRDEIEEWEKGIAEYIDNVESECERYAYSRKNSWRKTVPDGKKYDLNPRYYDTQQEYMEALNEARYEWREWYEDEDLYGLDLNAFETQDEFEKALQSRILESTQKERERKHNEKENDSREQKRKSEDIANDKNIYTYCGVLLAFSSQPYYFLTDDDTIQIGDTVVVPVGEKSNELKGTVVSVGKYTRIAVPYPLEKTKKIIGKAEQQANGEAEYELSRIER